MNQRKSCAKTIKEMQKELRTWNKLVDDERFDQGYVLGFRMALKWALGVKFPPDGEKR